MVWNKIVVVGEQFEMSLDEILLQTLHRIHYTELIFTEY